MKNAVVWSEIAVVDLKRATAFYEKLLDGKLKHETFGPFRIACFPYAPDGVGGCLVNHRHVSRGDAVDRRGARARPRRRRRIGLHAMS